MVKLSSKNSREELENSVKISSKKAIGNALVRFATDEKKEVIQKERIDVKFKTGSTQDMIPVKDISFGVIHTLDNRHVCIIETTATNYEKMPLEKKIKCIERFGGLFRQRREKWQFKIVNDNPNATELIKNIKKAGRYNKNLALDISINDYLNYVKQAGSQGASNTRYLIIVEYEGESATLEEIGKEMINVRQNIQNTLLGCGVHTVVNWNEINKIDFDMDTEQLELLYMYFNRRTIETESLNDRARRMAEDFNAYNSQSKTKKNITVSDMIAPKGLSFNNRKYVFMDGQYYGYIGFKSNKYPNLVEGAWLDLFAYGNVVDIDVIAKKLPRETVKNSIALFNNYTQHRVVETQQKGDYTKAQKYHTRYSNNKYVESQLNAGDDIYNFAIIITVRANSARQLGDYIRFIENDLRTAKNIDIDTCFNCAEEYMLMTMPLLYITKPFNRIKHNILGSQLKSIFPMTAYNLYDPRGWVAGINKDNGALCALNLFNIDLYKNANLLILGAPGSGKTFTLKLMSLRNYYNGIACYFIIPKKGYDFIPCVKMTGGSYVPLFPGNNICLNIMEIRPEKDVDSEVIDESVVVDKRPLLGKKITNLVTWLRLVCDSVTFNSRIANLINECLVRIYYSYGITVDNESIWEDKKNRILKKMPIIQDMYDEFGKYPELTEIQECLRVFISGSYSNFNGQTNVNLNSDFIVFDCDEDDIGEQMHAAIMYIAFDFCYDRVKDPLSGRSMIIMDEAWKMMSTPESAKQVQNMVKLVRGYLSSTCIATQEIEDFFHMDGGYGKSVINDSATKLLLGMEPNGTRLVREYLNLTPTDEDAILNYRAGNGLLISQGQKTEIAIQASPYEFKILSDKTRSTLNA